MSRPLLALIAILLVVIVGAVWLGSRTVEVPQTRVEKPVMNEAAGS